MQLPLESYGMPAGSSHSPALVDFRKLARFGNSRHFSLRSHQRLRGSGSGSGSDYKSSETTHAACVPLWSLLGSAGNVHIACQVGHHTNVQESTATWSSERKTPALDLIDRGDSTCRDDDRRCGVELVT